MQANMNGLLPYLSYLKPTDGIQTVFLVIIILLSVGTAVWVKFSTKSHKGKPCCWEIRWTNNTPTNTTDDLKAEYGSVQELSDAVALPSEKLAEVLPSMLLVVGLMGTFLGVGVALNDAADVLKDSERPPMEMLQQMVSMLDGLGALFKSSIYGIIGFFLFTLWRNKWGTDEERFKWCVIQCNKELEGKESEAERFQRAQKENTETIIAALNKVNESIGESIADCIKKSLQTALVKGFESINDKLNEVNTNLCYTLETTVVEGFKGLQRDMKKQVKETESVVKQLEDLAVQSRSQTEMMEGLSSTMKEQFAYVATSAKSMGKAADSLSKSVDEFTPAVTSTLNNIQTQFVESINASGKIMEDAGSSIRVAVEDMSAKTTESQAKLDSTLENFSKRINITLDDIQESTEAVKMMSGAFQNSMNELIEKIDQKLGSIGTANMNIRSAMKLLPKELAENTKATHEEMKTAIDSSVSRSAENITETIEKGFAGVSNHLSVKSSLVATEG